MSASVFCIISVLIIANFSAESQFDEALNKASEQFREHFTNQWIKQSLKYEGPDIKVKLTISDKIFYSSAHVLFNSKHGVTLFIHEFLGTNKNSINHACNIDDDNDNSPESDDNTLFKFDQTLKDKMDIINHRRRDEIIELYFDRDPEFFPYILKFLRGYPVESELYELNVRKLEILSCDAIYFGLKDLEQLLTDTLYSRFNPYLCASPSRMLIADNGVRVKKNDQGNHVSCSVYGVLFTGKRYVEFDINTHGNRYQMIGVTEANNFKSGPYAGHANTKGISLYGANGHIYRNGGNEGWSASFHHGDRVGVLVDISEDKRDAKITWYINGKKIKHALDLRQYMNIDNGVVFTVNMHDINEEVQIVQYPVMPKF